MIVYVFLTFYSLKFSISPPSTYEEVNVCYKVSDLFRKDQDSDDLFVSFRYVDRSVFYSPYFLMTIRMEFVDKEDDTNIYVDTKRYHLFYHFVSCQQTLKISQGNYTNYIIVAFLNVEKYLITISVGEESPELARFKFVTYDTQEDKLFSISDENKLLYLFVDFSSDSSHLVPHDYAGEILYDYYSYIDPPNDNCIFSISDRDVVVFNYSQREYFENTLSPMMQIDIIVYQNYCEYGCEEIYRRTFTGWRIDCTHEDIPSQFSFTNLIYPNFLIGLIDIYITEVISSSPLVLKEEYEDNELVHQQLYGLNLYGIYDQLRVYERMNNSFARICKLNEIPKFDEYSEFLIENRVINERNFML
ncbi:hypothetical protein RF11_11100 [Thelohanellus kitauei]|uniref:Uncharacterized protein n=1 Tax=Thelohanellus kitauei TaxID=669202 RepID=A0A0C2IVQ6_THEKT|nr:hypothetical protein RF11_11100 [Thelohanellus kitauei]